MHLFACELLTIVTNVEFQVTFARHVSARDRPAQQGKNVLSYFAVVTS